MWTAFRLFTARLRAQFGGAAHDREFARELESHLEMLTEDNVRRGMAPDEAARKARLTLGAASSLQSRHRDVRGFRLLEDFFQDLRFATRLMLKDRWLSAAAVLAIALGIGANTMGFSIINAAFIRGFNFERAEELHSISWRPTRGRRLPSSVLDLEDWRSQSRSFSSIGAASFGAINLSDDHAAPEQTQGSRITANLFDVLGQRPLLGRSFVEGEDRRGADPVVIIGYDIWTNRYARDPNVIGRILKINGSPATIVGVMPDGMKFPDNSELWVPFIPIDPQMTREMRLLSVFGRLAAHVTKEQASTEIDGIAQRIIKAHPNQAKNVVGGQVETLIERFLNGAAPRMFKVIMGAVMFVLLIACANVANLLLSRAAYRSREVAVRYALGATRWRIVRQLLIESVALASLGGIAGLALAGYGVRAFDAAIHATGAPYWLRFTIDYRVLLYVAGICIATGVIFGLAPALQVSRDNAHDTLKEGARGTAGNRRAGRLGGVMVVSELALTIVLLCGAGLMLRSFIALYAVPAGFDVDGLTRMRMQLPPSNYPDAEARRRFFDQLLPKVEVIPGVQRAAMTTAVPPLDHEEWRVIVAGSRHVEDDRRPFVSTVAVSPQYFETLGVAVTRGRGIENGRRRAWRGERGHQSTDGRPLFRRRRSDRPATPLRAPSRRARRPAAAVAHHRRRRPDISARQRQRCVSQYGGLSALSERAGPDLLADHSQRTAAGQHHGSGPQRRAVDRCRSAGVQHRNSRAGLCERAVDLPHHRHAVCRARDDWSGVVRSGSLRSHRLRRHPTDAGNRRARGDRCGPLGCGVAVPAKRSGADRHRPRDRPSGGDRARRGRATPAGGDRTQRSGHDGGHHRRHGCGRADLVCRAGTQGCKG